MGTFGRGFGRKLSTLVLAGGAVAALGVSAAAVAQAPLPVVGHKDRSYSQELVTVRSGGQVRFDNDDNVAHNITVRDPSGRQLSWIMLRPGEHTDFAFQVAGDHAVTCAVHPRKRMTVRVV
jgi:plastocyanin